MIVVSGSFSTSITYRRQFIRRGYLCECVAVVSIPLHLMVIGDKVINHCCSSSSALPSL